MRRFTARFWREKEKKVVYFTKTSWKVSVIQSETEQELLTADGIRISVNILPCLNKAARKHSCKDSLEDSSYKATCNNAQYTKRLVESPAMKMLETYLEQ